MLKAQQRQNKKLNIKTLARTENRTRNLSHPKQMHFLCPTESIEIIGYSQAI